MDTFKIDDNINFDTEIQLIKEQFNIGKSFDVIGREVKVLDKRGYIVFVDGFCKDDMAYYILNNLQKSKDTFGDVKSFINEQVGYFEVEELSDIEEMKKAVFSGQMLLFIESAKTSIGIDIRNYPVRSVEESQNERIMRGAKDGFVETIVFNTALIRRRLRCDNLIFEYCSIGEKSKTDVAIAYLDGDCDEKVLDEIRTKISNIKIDALTVGDNYLIELLLEPKWYNPMPLAKQTERPDVISAHLLEGHIALIVDNSPVVSILPATLFNFTQYIDDYNKNFINGSLVRMARFIAILISLFLIPTAILITKNPEIFGTTYDILATKDKALLSPLRQLAVLELGFMLLQMSSMHVPSHLSVPFGIIGGILIGDIIFKLNILSMPMVLLMALTAICMYAIPNMEFTNAVRIFRLVILTLTAMFNIVGFVLGVVYTFACLLFTKSLKSSKRFSYPLIPFDKEALHNVLLRRPIYKMKDK